MRDYIILTLSLLSLFIVIYLGKHIHQCGFIANFQSCCSNWTSFGLANWPAILNYHPASVLNLPEQQQQTDAQQHIMPYGPTHHLSMAAR